MNKETLMCAYLHKKCKPCEDNGCAGMDPKACNHACTWERFRRWHCPYRDTEDDDLQTLEYIKENKCLVCSLEWCPLLK